MFLIPTPDCVVSPKAERAVCLRVPPPGFLPVIPFVDSDSRPISSADASWLGKHTPSQPADPEPALVPSAKGGLASREVVLKATRRARAAACADLKILEAVPPNDEAAFCRVVTEALAERFGSVRAITIARARLPVPLRIFDPAVGAGDQTGCPGPYTIERAADSGVRRSFVRQLERGFNLSSGRPVDDDWRLPDGATPLSLLFLPLPRYQRARFDVRAFVQACQQHILLDGASHPDFPGYEAMHGCFHGPPHICRCGVPRPRVGADPMARLKPELADHVRAAMPHTFNN